MFQAEVWASADRLARRAVADTIPIRWAVFSMQIRDPLSGLFGDSKNSILKIIRCGFSRQRYKKHEGRAIFARPLCLSGAPILFLAGRDGGDCRFGALLCLDRIDLHRGQDLLQLSEDFVTVDVLNTAFGGKSFGAQS